MTLMQKPSHWWLLTSQRIKFRSMNGMKVFLQCLRVILSLTVFSFMSCEKTKDLPISIMIKPGLSAEQCEGLCSKINNGFEVINTLTRALRYEDVICSTVNDESGKIRSLSFISGNAIQNIETFSRGVTTLPGVGLSRDNVGQLCWVIVDKSRFIVYDFFKDDGYDEMVDEYGYTYNIKKEKINEYYQTFGKKVPISGEIRMAFNEVSKTLCLYEGNKLLCECSFYNDNWSDSMVISGGYSRNIRSCIKKEGSIEFELLDGSVLTIPYSPLLLKLDASSLTFKKGGGTHEIHYTLSGVVDKATLEAEVSNGWQVSITPEALTSGTITITAPETIEETTITITAKESDRTAKCELKCGKPMFYLPQKEFKLGYEGKNLSVPVKTNLNSFVKIPDDAQSWIEWVTEETTDEKIMLRVSENNGAFSRNATIWCLDEDGIVLDKFNVSQSWDQDKIFEVRVSDAGTLHEYMKAHNMLNIRKLKVSGSLSDDDFFFLGGMRSLKYLDASDVDALSLPNGCFINSEYCEMFVLPKTLTAISEKCFYGCESIKKILIPASCETIGVSAFECCSRLSSISFESGSCLKTMSYSSFKGCSSLTSISIPASCETIGVSVFERCSCLSSVIFENGSCLKTISSSAFASCRALKTITIPASCNTIGDNAFNSCTSLTDFSCAGESALTSIGAGAFKYCDNLHRIDMRNCTKLKSIGSKAFYGDNQIYSFQIGVAVPPSCPTDAFDNVGEYSVLKVPSGSEDAYKAASGWSEFYKIIANE